MTEARRSLPPRPRWVPFAFIAFFVIAAFISLKACQDQDVRIDQEQAVATAREQIDFTPDRTAVRFLRQGLRSNPFYAISFTRGRQGDADRRVVTVLIDARSGAVAQVRREA